jgi:hypothetical protein
MVTPENFVIADATTVRSLRALKAEYGKTSVANAFVACRIERAYPLPAGQAVHRVLFEPDTDRNWRNSPNRPRPTNSGFSFKYSKMP